MSHVHPDRDRVISLIRKGVTGPIIMLNLLRFRDVADYSETPELAPDEPISGAEAYRRYAAHTLPFLAEVGAELLFRGPAHPQIIGPEQWDEVLVVKHQSVEAFLGFAQNKGYLAGAGHRTAGLADSRLLPFSE